jgi:transcriptional regulator with XRE-family HTH domain
MDIKNKLGKRVKELRLTLGYSQEAFAHECGLDRTYIASLENGKRNVSIVNIEKISIALNVSLRDFFSSELFGGN